MSEISLTIPVEAGILKHTITMLQAVLSDIENAPILAPIKETKPFLKRQETSALGEITTNIPASPAGIIDQVIDNELAVDTETELEESELENSLAPPGVDLDSTSLPWDGRINVKTKTKRKSDQTWTLRKNVDPVLVNQVREELKQLMSSKVKPTDSEPGLSANDMFGETSETVAAPNIDPFHAFLQKITDRLSDPSYKDAFNVMLSMELPKHGVSDMGGLMSRPDLIPQVDAAMEAQWNTLTAMPQ